MPKKTKKGNPNWPQMVLSDYREFVLESDEENYHSNLNQAAFFAGKFLVNKGIESIDTISYKLGSLIQCPEGNDEKIDSLRLSLRETIQKGVMEGSQLRLSKKDQDFPLDPRIADDFPRNPKTGERLRVDPDYEVEFMDRLTKDAIKFNVRNRFIYLEDKPQEVPEKDRIRFLRNYGWAPSTNMFKELLYGLARSNEYDPVKDYLDSLEPLDITDSTFEYYHTNLLAELFNLNPSEGYGPLYQRFLQIWLVNAVSRVYKPGCQADEVLVLQGGQGLGKTNFFSAIGDGVIKFAKTGNRQINSTNRWVDDINCKSIGTGNDKDSLMSAHKHWVVVLDEIDQLSGREAGAIKSFLTKAYDDYRVPYGSATETHPRRFIFGGTTNAEKYLSDPTGNRRYFTIPVEEELPLLNIRDNRNLIWAYAKTCFLNNLVPHLSKAERELQTRLNSEHEIGTGWEDIVESMIDMLSNDPVFWGDEYRPGAVFKVTQLMEVCNIEKANNPYNIEKFRMLLEKQGFIYHKAIKAKDGNKSKAIRGVTHRTQNFSKGRWLMKAGDVYSLQQKIAAYS